jgi:hypothetical protein
METKQETKEEKIDRLRAEKELDILKKKYCNEEFYLSGTGGLSRYGWGKNIIYVGMLVRVVKPNGAWRRGEVEYIKLEDNIPKIGVVCGKNKVKFEKNWGQVIPDNRIEEIMAWEGLEVPERLKKMSTPSLLREYRKLWRFRGDEEIRMTYKKELYLREHVGDTNEPAQKKIRQKRAKEKNGKRN